MVQALRSVDHRRNRSQGEPKVTTSAQGPRSLSVELIPRSDRFSSDHPSWAAQVNTLWGELEGSAGTVSREVTTAPGKKGGGETIILALGSAGAISAMVEVIKAWLGRDRSRSLEIATVDGHGRRSILIRGVQVDDATMRAAVEKLVRPGDV
jgi:hypothetical protein